jgi:hypothetical protein
MVASLSANVQEPPRFAIHPLPTMATVTTVSASGQTTKKDYPAPPRAASPLAAPKRADAVCLPGGARRRRQRQNPSGIEARSRSRVGIGHAAAMSGVITASAIAADGFSPVTRHTDNGDGQP